MCFWQRKPQGFENTVQQNLAYHCWSNSIVENAEAFLSKCHRTAYFKDLEIAFGIKLRSIEM